MYSTLLHIKSFTLDFMHISFKGTHIDMTKAIELYFKKRFARIEKFLKKDGINVYVELGRSTHHHKSGDVYRAEVNITGSAGTFRTTSVTTDLYNAIDDVVGEMFTMLSSEKDRKYTLYRRGAQQYKHALRTSKDVVWA
jgi:ribosomal subunit interface protein